MKYLEKVLLVAALSVTLFGIHIPLAYGQTTEWTFNTPSLTGGDGMQTGNVKHNGNLLIDKITLPYIKVVYGQSGRVVVDQIGIGSYDHHHKHDLSGQTYWHAVMYFGCQPLDWPSYTCYKYEQTYYFIDSSDTFRPYIKIYGDGYAPQEGYPGYHTRWRVDTNIPQSANGDSIQRWTGSSWSAPITVEASYIEGSSSGVQWRTYDHTVGNSKSFGIDPLTYTTATLYILRYNANQDDPTSIGYYVEESTWDNDESVQNANIVLWYKNSEQASSTRCNSSAPCTGGSSWIAAGGL
jgi:hypothetical protein